jgi:hypothetical protein
MQLFQQPFDASKVKPRDSFEPIPEAWYNLAIRNSEAKPTKDNESGYLVLEIEVLDGEYKGRKVFDNLNLWNKSIQASEIAQGQLSAYCHATGVLIVQESSQLHGIPFKGKVGIQHDPGYEPKNKIKAVKHIQDSVPSTVPAAPFGPPALPAAPAGPSGFAPPAAPAAAPSMPWQQPAQPAPAAPPAFGQQQAPFMPPAAQPASQAPAASGPVPPWRR